MSFNPQNVNFYASQIGRAKGSPTVAKFHTPHLKSHLKSLKSLKFQNLKSRTVETVISKFLYISASKNREDNIKQALSKGN